MNRTITNFTARTTSLLHTVRFLWKKLSISSNEGYLVTAPPTA